MAVDRGRAEKLALLELGIPITATLAEARVALANSDAVSSLLDEVPVTRTVRVSFLWTKSQRPWSEKSRWMLFCLCSWVRLAMLVMDDGGKGMSVHQPQPDLVS